MTVPPRYTARAKVFDLTTGYALIYRASAPVLRAMLISILGATRLVITTRYIDPKEKP